MGCASLPQAVELIQHILERFHETHRRELPEILRLAQAVEAQGGPAGLAARFAGMADAIEDHLSKEEMRLFPMMEQGGHMMIAQLIEDMNHEHRSHEETMAGMAALLASLPAAGSTADVTALRAAVAKLFDDLVQHIHAEDEVLFPLFLAPAAWQ
jgi:regulator of cell morphogenesis and NO signaling